MTYTPMIAGSGLVGWQMLQSTLESQRTAFNKSAEITRDSEYFKEKIGTINSAEELVNDRRLLSVALSAFGMDDQIDSKYLIRRVLEEGTKDDDALANKLSDSRFTVLAEVFDFEKIVSYRTQEKGFADPIFAAYEKKVLADLEVKLAEPEYVADPEYAALFETQVKRNIEISREYFNDNIGGITSPDELLLDFDLMQVVMGAFDIEDRRGSKALLKRVLEEGGSDPNALANVLGDKRLIRLAEAFSFDKSGPTNALQADSFANNIIEQYRWQRFEDAVGEVDPAIGTALQFQRSIPDLATSDISDSAKWYSILGSTTSRSVVETALSLPKGFSQIDIDKQVEILKDKMDRRFGVKEVSDLEDPATLRKIVHSYLLQEQIAQSSGYQSNQIAITLLSTIRYDQDR